MTAGDRRLADAGKRGDFAEFLDAATLHYCAICQRRFHAAAGELICRGCASDQQPVPTPTLGYLRGALIA